MRILFHELIQGAVTGAHVVFEGHVPFASVSGPLMVGVRCRGLNNYQCHGPIFFVVALVSYTSS